MSVLVYTPQITSRVKYTFFVLFEQILGVENIRFTSEVSEFEAAEVVKLNYSKTLLQSGIHFWPHGLLQEKDISEQNIRFIEHRDLPAFFPVSNSSLPFDVFAASFYLISRYEEYLPHISDDHNRFMATESLAYKNNFLHLPVVNIWAQWVKELVLERYPETTFAPQPYSFISTVDVDNLYAYKSKGLLRTLGGFTKDLLSLKISTLIERARSVVGWMQDPYDTFNAQIEANEELGIESIYFMLFAEFAQYDRNISMFSPRMHVAVRSMNDFTTVGIHPSYRSNEDEKIVERELRGLEEALRQRVKNSRQHFLKMRFPETFRNLVELGITDEYSMGYAAESGFRASIATPYTFYDLEMEVPVPLTIHPFMVMDVTFIDYHKKSTDQALAKMKELVDATKAVNGQFVSVFHNRVFSEQQPEWRGCFEVYRALIKYAKA